MRSRPASVRPVVLPALFVLAASLPAAPANGQDAGEAPAVRPSETGAFVIERSVTLPGTPEEIWEVVTGDIDAWWDHHVSEDPHRFYIEPTPGGCFCEIFDASGDGVVHATVTFARRPETLRFVGPLGFMGNALHMVTTYRLEARGDSTRLGVEIHGSGEVREGWPEAIDGVWQHFLVERLKPHVEGDPGGAEAQDAGSASADVIELDPADPAWQLRGDVRAGRHDGRDALLLRTGSALHRDLVFSDGTVAFDVAGTEERAFLGLLFRREGAGGASENVYLRLHKSRLPDALQYTPNYRGQGQWQLYHGSDATASAAFTPGTWQPVRIEVLGSRAAVFVGESGEPQLIVDRLRTDRRTGGLLVWANQPGAGPDAPLSAAVSNLRVLPDSTTHDFGDPPTETSAPGAILGWGLSPPFPVEDATAGDAPPEVAAARWRTVRTEATGLLPLDRHLDRADGGAGTGVLAGLSLTADRERTARLDLGFSDNVTVFLNGRPIVTSRFSFSHNFPRRQGLLTPDQATVHLPLRAGANRLLLLVSETAFGGWGLMGRIEDRTGLKVAPWSGGRI